MYIVATQFDKDKHPQCVKDVRAFTERYIKEMQMKKIESERLVRLPIECHRCVCMCTLCMCIPCSRCQYCVKRQILTYQWAGPLTVVHVIQVATVSACTALMCIYCCRAADAFKAEGNTFFTKGQLESAIACYTKALDTCPLTCTERRVTYHRWEGSAVLEIYSTILQSKTSIDSLRLYDLLT